jgi:hypothetical protein
MTKYITEMLEEIANDPSLIAKYKDNVALKLVLGYAFIPDNKFILPEGEPPYKPDSAPLGMTPTNLMQEIRRLYIFTKAKDLLHARREQLFIQLLETVHPTEAKLLLAIKDQTLCGLYPGLNVEALIEAGLLPTSLVYDHSPKHIIPIKKNVRKPRVKKT